MIYSHFKPTMLDVFSSENVMCRKFWAEIQREVMLRRLGEFDVFHISNNQHGGCPDARRKQSMDKAVGVVKGVADYRVDRAPGYLEAKVCSIRIVNGKQKIVKGAQTPEQKRFMQHCLDNGIKYEVFYTPAQGLEILRVWGVLK